MFTGILGLFITQRGISAKRMQSVTTVTVTVKFSCAAGPHEKAGKGITADGVIELMQHGGDLV